jgi:hypothetical protein
MSLTVLCDYAQVSLPTHWEYTQCQWQPSERMYNIIAIPLREYTMSLPAELTEWCVINLNGHNGHNVRLHSCG